MKNTLKPNKLNAGIFFNATACKPSFLGGIVLLCASFMIVRTSFAQSHRIVAVANPKPQAIQLRWSPASFIAWETGNKYGYIVERFTLLQNGTLVSKPAATLLTPQPLKPFSLQQMEAAAANDEQVSIIAEMIYGEEGQKKVKPEEGIGAYWENKNINDWRMAMALLACDLSKEAARSAGLFIEDASAKKGEKYAYRIYVARQPKNLLIDTAYITASVDEPVQLAPPQELAIVCADSTATLGWLTAYNSAMYTAWMIERSANGKHFTPVSKLPIIPTNADVNGFVYYQDSLPDNNNTYHYRMRGITAFGEYGPYSKTVKGVGVPLVSDRPVLDTMVVIDNKKIQLRWILPGELSKQLSSIVITRAEKSGGPFLPIATLKSNSTTYTDTKPFNSNYYRIKGITKSGKAIYSFPYLGQLIDNIAPAIPLGLVGKIDSAGIVSLQWQGNTEKDLQGYRVFRGNSAKEEFMEITQEIQTVPRYTDTVSLHTLSSRVYYKIIAVDKNYNTSDYTAHIAIKRPDTIAPAAPIMVQAYRNDSLKAIVLQWINSNSEDVVKHTLQRVNVKDSLRKEILAWDTTKTHTSYTDTALQQRNTYYYELTAYDDSNNKTKEQSGDVWFETGKRAAITDWSAKADNAKKQVLLQWNCPHAGIKKYYLYRSKNGDPYILFSTLSGADKTYTDKEITMGNAYRYRISAVLQGDIKTEMSKEVEVKL